MDGLESAMHELCSAIHTTKFVLEREPDDAVFADTGYPAVMRANLKRMHEQRDRCIAMLEPAKQYLVHQSGLVEHGGYRQPSYCEIAMDIAHTADSAMLAFTLSGDGFLETCRNSALATTILVDAITLQKLIAQEIRSKLVTQQAPIAWTDWMLTKTAKVHFEEHITSKTGWTDFANRMRSEGLMENHPHSGATKIRIQHSVYASYGLTPPD